MALSKYHSNCILTGTLDAYCFVCEDCVKNVDLSNHISKPIHKKNLDSTPYFEKHKDIRKVKRGYYCEYCNHFFSTAAIVSLHVTEAQHSFNKGSKLLRRVGNSVLAYDHVSIGDKAWNGIVETTCVVCNAEFSDENIHKTDHAHVLNLIQKQVEFYGDKFLYRKIDNNSCQCLTCNIILASDTLSEHFDGAEHIKCYEISRATGLDIIKNADVTEPPKFDKTVNKPVPVVENKDKNNVTTQKETVKSKSKNKENQNNVIGKNAIEMDKYICETMNAKDYMLEEDGEYLCLICQWAINKSLLRSHVKERHHQTLLKMHKENLQRRVRENKENERAGKEASDSNKENIINSLVEFQKNNITVNFETDVAVCKVCSKQFDLVFDVIQAHIKEHNDKSEPNNSNSGATNKSKNSRTFKKQVLTDKNVKEETPVIDKQVTDFAKENDITYKNGKMMCEICNSDLTASLKCLKEHIGGIKHKSNLKYRDRSMLMKPVVTKKVRMCDFIKSITGVFNTTHRDIIINEECVINLLSFLMVTSQNFVPRCEPCELCLNPNEIENHINTPSHQRAMAETMVITSLESEFVREVRPGIYHCGFCCEVHDGWNDLQEHLTTTSHTESKNSAEWRLREHMDMVREKKRQAMFERSLLAFMMNGGLRNLF